MRGNGNHCNARVVAQKLLAGTQLGQTGVQRPAMMTICIDKALRDRVGVETHALKDFNVVNDSE